MSIEGLVVAWESDLPPATKLVMMHLGDILGDDRTCHLPKLSEIAERASITEDEARSVLRWLVAERYIAIERPVNPMDPFLCHFLLREMQEVPG